MKDIKDILVYLGLSFKVFLIQLSFHFLSLLLLVVLIFSVFLFYYKLLTRTVVFILLFCLILMVHHLLKNKLLLKQHWVLMTGFASFLKNPARFVSIPEKEKESIQALSPVEIRSGLKGTRAVFREKGARIYSKKLLWSVASLRQSVCHDFVPDHDMGKRMKRVAWKYFIIKILFFLMLLIPFILISILFTMGLRVELKFLIVLLGFGFVYFLNAAISEPLFYLLVQQKIFNMVSQFSQGT
jgi:hypothetical protein